MAPKPSPGGPSEPVVRVDRGRAKSPPKAVKASPGAVTARMDRREAPPAKPMPRAKTVVTARLDKAEAKPAPMRKVAVKLETKVDKAEATTRASRALEKVQAVIHAAPRRRLDLTPQDFDAFFQAEIDEEVRRPATLHNDRFVRWRCQCCDELLRVPRRSMVLHGEYMLVHDDELGLLVNGERWVPKADSEGGLTLVQPGRLKDPFTGSLIKTGKYAV